MRSEQVEGKKKKLKRNMKEKNKKLLLMVAYKWIVHKRLLYFLCSKHSLESALRGWSWLHTNVKQISMYFCAHLRVLRSRGRSIIRKEMPNTRSS